MSTTPLIIPPADINPLVGRIASMDQFRGYAVLGMFVVNFVASLAAISNQLKHNSLYFSLADSIMPSFLFAAGFSFRLTLLRRVDQPGRKWFRPTLIRSLMLILVSMTYFGFGQRIPSWTALTSGSGWGFIAQTLKADLWNVLAIIGATQLLILPVVRSTPWVRILTAVAFIILHVLLSYSFNYEFVYGRPNAMDAWWGAAGTRAWDGGFFGLLMWSVPMLAGTLAYDFVTTSKDKNSGAKLFCVGLGLMLAGYLLSCLGTLYQAKTLSPVLPPLGEIAQRFPHAMLADSPFDPPDLSIRAPNYWMMDKRAVSAPFILFSSGFAFAIYSLFVWVCDRQGLKWDYFRTLGQNPLAAYLLHYPIFKSVLAIVPKDAPLWWCLLGLSLYLAIMTLFLKFLDRHKLYLRL